MHYLYLAAAIVCEVIGTTALKSSNGFTSWGPSAVVIVGYGAAFYLLSLCLNKISVGAAYAIWSGVGIVLIALLGWVIHKQKLDPAAVVGMALIVAGVVVMNRYSNTIVH